MTTNLTRSAVRIYGALTALGNGSQDVLTKLLPFLEPVLLQQNGSRFNPGQFAESVRDTYKWNFNTDIVEAFVPRLLDARWLTVEDEANGIFTITAPEHPDISIEEASAADELKEIARRFQSFAEDLSPLTAIPIDLEKYEDILIEWLVYVEAFSEKSIEFNKSFRTDEHGTMRSIVEIPNITSLNDEEKFLCARFVKEELRCGGSTSETLARLASIGLLTEVVQDFVRPTDPVRHTDLIVYLDGPIALELLGVSGRAARDNTVPVIKELQHIGAQVRIFAQSLEEMRKALSAVLQNPRPTGPTAQALARGEVLREYVTQVASDPTQLLENEGVAVTNRTLQQFPSEESFFTPENRKVILEAQTFQQNFSARDHDSDITTLVMRQRRGRTSRDIFSAKFLVMTKNGLLAQVVRKACVEMGLLSRSEIPPVVHRRVLSTAMWLRTGLGADDLEVPKRMLLAGCEQVLAVRKGVVEAVKKMTDALGDDEKSRQLDILIQQDRSAQMLMDKTLGAPSVVTEDNLSVLFAEMIHPHLEAEREKKREAVSAEKAKRSELKKQFSAQLQDEQAQKLAAVSEIEKAREEDEQAVSALCSDVEKRLKRSRNVRWFIAGVLALAFSAPAVFGGTPWGFAITVVLSTVLALLTLTGGKLIGVKTGPDKALYELRLIAEKRGILRKIDRYSITWDGKEFSKTRHT